MNSSNELTALTEELDGIYQQLTAPSKPRTIQQVEKPLQALYGEMCSLYFDSRPEERVDAVITLLYRDNLLAQLVLFYRNVTKQAAKLAERKRQEAQAQQLIRQSLAAHALLADNVVVSTIDQSELLMQRVCMALDVDTNSLMEQAALDYHDFVERTIHYQRQQDRMRAIKCLSQALKLNPKLEDNDKVRTIAAGLTGETELSAILTLSDGYVVRKFLEQIERAQKSRKDTPDKSRSTMEIIRSWFDAS